MEYLTTISGERQRVHREHVNVYCRMVRDGTILPVRVLWRDGRSFPVDEVVETGSFSAMSRGRQTARYRVRMGRYETDLFLERRERVPALGEPERLLWWVNAYDQVRPGTATG